MWPPPSKGRRNIVWAGRLVVREYYSSGIKERLSMIKVKTVGDGDREPCWGHLAKKPVFRNTE